MKVAVFCASADEVGEVYKEAARLLGKEIAWHSWELIYGGTNCGLMREVAEAALQEGGKVRGVIPRCIVEKGMAARNLTELIEVEDMKERKQLMREQADAFVALPGGWGTLEEITEVITLKQLGLHHKPVVFLNTAGFYEDFFGFIRQATCKGFISGAYDGGYTLAATPSEALDYITLHREEKYILKYERK